MRWSRVISWAVAVDPFQCGYFSKVLCSIEDESYMVYEDIEMAELRLYLFGMPRLEYQGSPVTIDRRKALALVAYLALIDRKQSRDVIANLLWPDLDRDHARSALRSALYTLTSVVPIEWIQSDRHSLALKSDVLWADVSAFITLLGTNKTHGHGPDVVCDECVPLYKEAIALYTADFLGGFSLPDSVEYEDWQLAQQEWLSREFANLHRLLSDYYAQTQCYDQAIKYAQAWLEVDVLHEPAHRQLMSLYAASGQRAEALRQYQQCVQILDDELVTLPDDETIQLYEAIQNNRLPASPERGGSKFSVASSVMPPLPSLTVGREDAIREIKRRLGVGNSDMRPVTVIQGWPGVGKSTTVAGLAHDTEIMQQFPDGILWTSLGEKPGLPNEIAVWAEALGVSEPGRVRQVDEVTAQLITILRDRRILLIVDDVWQVEHANPFRVGGQQCALIMTSRLNDVANALAPTASDIYRLPVLSETAALTLLEKLAPEVVARCPDEARELVRDLEGLPLAIQVAGRLLHSEAHLGWGVRELLDELKTGAAVLSAPPPSDMVGAEHDPSPTVTALLKRSTDLLDDETRQRFAYLGLFVPKPATFDLEAMAVAWDIEDPRPVARVLVNRGLIEPISGGRFQMHALLVMHARSLLGEEH